MSYKDSHVGKDRGKIYDQRYSSGYTAAMWNRVERPLLVDIFKKYGGRTLSCLDFACGTGRITQLLQDEFGQVTGIDVSPDMLTIAQTKCPKVDFVCGDLREDSNLLGEFDVIVAFRFFPNAEQDLREEVMTALVKHLKPGGTMILNNHQNSHSAMGILRRIRGSSRDFMAPEIIPDLLRTNGLAVREKYGFGKIPVWRNWKIVPTGLLSGFEKKTVSRGDAADRDQNIIYVSENEA
jgi:SAM-dependent methyltransferase